MNWRYIKKLESENLITEFESLAGYTFSESFKSCVIQNNGGRPELRCFNTDVANERSLKTFLSFNKGDIETIWNYFDWNKEELADKYVPFAVDNFGNLICFDKSSNNVVFLNLENLSVESISDTFSAFLNSLYERAVIE